MVDTLKIGLLGLQAFQRALSTTGHNIANVNTPGFSRQRVEFTTQPPEYVGLGYMGNGVGISTIRRMYDGFAVEQVRTAQSAFTQQQTFYELSAQVDNLLGDPATSLAAGLQDFFNSVQEVADDPTSSAARQVMLTEGETLSARFHQLNQGLENLRERTDTQIENTVAEINTLATSIAEINAKISIAQGRSAGGPPNDLLDQRDILVEELAQQVSVTTVPQDDGMLNVFIGTGQSLVLGNQAMGLSARALGADPQRLEIAITSPGPTTVPVTGLISGGQLGGMLEFRDRVLDPSQNALGSIGIGMATVFNQQHQMGMDLNGVTGADFFVVPEVQVAPVAGNTGTVPMKVTINDVGRLTTEDYQLEYDGATWLLKRISDGQAVPFESGSGTAADPYIADGLSIVTDFMPATPAAGDKYLIQPTRTGAAQLEVALSDNSQIAAAGALYTETVSTNTGDAQISSAQVLDLSDPGLLNTVNIVFDTDTSFQIEGGASIPYSSGSDIDINSVRVQISGNPKTGDRFSISSNVGGVGDNSNALLLAGLQQSLSLSGGTASFEDAYSAIVANVGTRTHQAEINASAQGHLLEQAQAKRDSISAVNLDEEAANLLRFQQAYQAAAKVISIADETFDILMNAVRG
jgi:flagellar hook-associated protein 1 FlgK